MRRSCTPTAALTASAGSSPAPSLHDADRHGHRGADHHLPLRAGAGDPGGAGGRVGRAVPLRRHPQRRRRDRAAGRGRHGRVRQDRHADAAGAARRQCRRRSIPTCWNAPRGSRCRAAIRSRPRSRARRASARRIDGAVEEPGQGVRAMIDGVEARLGSAGILRHRRCGRRRDEPGTSLIAFAHGGRTRVLRDPPDAAAGCRRGRDGAARRAASTCTSCRAIAPTAVAPIAAALGIAQLAGGPEAGRQDRARSTR